MAEEPTSLGSVAEGAFPSTVQFLDRNELILSGLGMGTQYAVSADPEGSQRLDVEFNFPTAALARSLAVDTRAEKLAERLTQQWNDAHPGVPVAVGEELAADATATGTPQGFYFAAFTPSGERVLERRCAWTPERAYLGRSMSKAFAAITLLALQDQGLLSIEDPVSRFLPEFGEGALAEITLRMLLVHTAGFPLCMANEGDASPPALTDPTMALREAAAQIASIPLVAAPGAEFHYTELGYQVAGAVAEVASGKPWCELFEEVLGGPMELRNTRWFNNFSTKEGGPNPLIAVGAVSCVHDLSKVGVMVVSGGTHVRADGSSVQIISQAAVDDMTRYQDLGDTSKCPIFKMLFFTRAQSKHMLQQGLISAGEFAAEGNVWSEVGYGLGAWLGREPGAGRRHVFFMGAYTSAMCLLGMGSSNPLVTMLMSYTRLNPIHGVLSGLCWQDWSDKDQPDAAA